MEGLILVVIVSLVLYTIGSRKKKKKLGIPIKVSVETSYDRSRPKPDQVIDTGNVRQAEENAFCINPKSPLPLTLSGLSKSDAIRIKGLLDGEAQWERNLSEITFLIAQQNIECIELEKYINQVRSNISKRIEEQKQNSTEWKEASSKDKADMMHEFQSAALKSLTIKPASEYALESLVFSVPGDVTADDKLLDIFSGNKALYRFYVSNLGRRTKANQIPADDHSRKNWESLTKLGLATRGKEIPIGALLEGLRVKDINDFFADRIDKKLTRKAKAIEFATLQPDVLDVLSQHISFREMFQISEPQGIEISEIIKCYEYAAAQAEVIRDTYVAGYRTLDTLEDAQDADYDGWEIEAEDCCPKCSSLNGKKTKKLPARIPPFHIGCTCSLMGMYD